MSTRPQLSLLRAFGFAFSGLGRLICTQRNARIHLALTMLALAMGIWLRLTPLSWAALALTMGLVWSAEAFNSAIEALVDIASSEWLPAAQAAKDLAAAAVLLAAGAALAVGLLLLGPPLLIRLGLI